MKKKEYLKAHFAVCLDNKDYPTSLEKRKVYRVIPDSEAGKEGLLRVIDESGEDYLYPGECFLAIHLPKEEEEAIAMVC